MTIAALAPYPTPAHPAEDHDDFSVLYRLYRPQLLRYITHHFGGRDADEITQEALTRALRSMDRDRSEAETWAWLIRVARNVAHDLARARRICESTDDDAVLANDVADDGILPEPAALLDERRRLVRRALKTLPPSQRRILVLYEVDELNCPAIARLMGSTEDAVRKALQRARRRFAAEVRAIGGGVCGSVGFWAGVLRRRAKVVPAASASTLVVALAGSAVLTVVSGAPQLRDLAPGYSTRAATSTPELGLGRDAARRSAASAASAALLTADDRRTGGSHEAPLVSVEVPGVFEPGHTSVFHVTILETSYGPVAVHLEIENDDQAGLVCSLPSVQCQHPPTG